jgi:hypothetical protein
VFLPPQQCSARCGVAVSARCDRHSDGPWCAACSSSLLSLLQAAPSVHLPTGWQESFVCLFPLFVYFPYEPPATATPRLRSTPTPTPRSPFATWQMGIWHWHMAHGHLAHGDMGTWANQKPGNAHHNGIGEISFSSSRRLAAADDSQPWRSETEDVSQGPLRRSEELDMRRHGGRVEMVAVATGENAVGKGGRSPLPRRSPRRSPR